MAASLVLRTGALSTRATGSTRGSRSGSPRTRSRDIPRILAPGRQPAALLPAAARLDARVSATARRPRGRCRWCSRCWRSPRRSGRGRVVFDRRAGFVAAAGAAGAPFLTYYAQETRMYSLVVLLSILASASFALAFVRGERRHVAWLGAVAGAAALHAHVGAVPGGVDGGRLDRAVAPRAGGAAATGRGWRCVLAALYAPWLPSVLSQAAHTAAPWAERPVAAAAARLPGRAVRLRRAAAAGRRGVLRAAAAPAGRPRGAGAGGRWRS